MLRMMTRAADLMRTTVCWMIGKLSLMHFQLMITVIATRV